MKKLIIGVLALLVSTIISWGVFNFLLYIICKCLGFEYSFGLGTGLYALVILITGVIRSVVK